MGSSSGSQFLSEYPWGIRCFLASISVAGLWAGALAALAAAFFGVAAAEGRAVCGRWGTEVELRWPCPPPAGPAGCLCGSWRGEWYPRGSLLSKNWRAPPAAVCAYLCVVGMIKLISTRVDIVLSVSLRPRSRGQLVSDAVDLDELVLVGFPIEVRGPIVGC
jgi:hypothetical protein